MSQPTQNAPRPSDAAPLLARVLLLVVAAAGGAPSCSERDAARPAGVVILGRDAQPLQYALSVQVAGEGGGAGSVASTPAGISCGSGTCSASFETHTVVQLRMTPAAGSVFAGWSGACTGMKPRCVVFMKGPRHVTATFRAQPVVPTGDWLRGLVSSGANGSVSIAGSALDPDENVYLHGRIGAGSMDLGCGALDAGTSGALFVAKLRKGDGACLWSKRFLATAFSDGTAITTDAAGNVVVSGAFYTSLNLGCGALSAAPNVREGYVASLAKADGACRWSVKGAAAKRLGRDKDGNLVVAADSTTFTCSGANNAGENGGAAVATLDAATGACRWRQGSCLYDYSFEGCGGPAGFEVIAVGPSPQGSTVVADIAGGYDTFLIVGGCNITFPNGAGSSYQRAVVVLRFDTAGACVSATKYPNEGSTVGAVSLAGDVASDGKIFLAGTTDARVSFGCGPVQGWSATLLGPDSTCLASRAYGGSPYNGLGTFAALSVAATRDPVSGEALLAFRSGPGEADFGCGPVYAPATASALVRLRSDLTCRGIDFFAGGAAPRSVHLGAANAAYLTTHNFDGAPRFGAAGISALPAASFAARIVSTPAERPTKTVTISASGDGTGTITYRYGGATHVCASPCTVTVREGEQLDVRAVAGASSRFVGWSGLCDTLSAGCAAAAYGTTPSLTGRFEAHTGVIGSSVRWSRVFTPTVGASVTTPTAALRGYTSDAAGNVLAAIDFRGTLNLGNGCTGTYNDIMYGRDTALMLAKLRASDGACVWSRTFTFEPAPTINGDAALPLVELGKLLADDSGHLVVSTRFRGSVALGGTGACERATSHADASRSVTRSDLWLLSLDGATGACRWSRVFATQPIVTTGNASSNGFSLEDAANVTTGPSGALYLFSPGAALVNSRFDLGCGQLATPTNGSGYLARLSAATGACVWSRVAASLALLPGSSSIAPSHVLMRAAADASALTVFGSFSDQIDLGCGQRSGGGGYHARFDPTSGACLLTKAPLASAPQSISLASDGSVVALGGADASCPGPGHLRRISATGECLSVRAYTTAVASGTQTVDISFAALSSVSTTGKLQLFGTLKKGVLDLGCGALSKTSGDGYVLARIRADGTCERAQLHAVTGVASSTAFGVATDAAGNATIGGSLGTVALDPSAPISHPAGSAATRSVFLGQLAP